MTLSPPTLTVVVPCYNEEDVLPETSARLDALVARLTREGLVGTQSRIYFVDDGSRDRTWGLIQDLREKSDRFAGIRLSRNCGHQIALMTGILAVPGDVIVSIDADLQDDINSIELMLQHAASGSDIVYGVRSDRRSDRALKRLTARTYYSLLHHLSVEIVFDHADFRLLTRRAVEALRLYEESNLFLRAIIPRLGFRSTIVPYERAERFSGSSKYTIPKMVALAIEGVTSFSITPLRLVTVMGCGISFFAFLLTVWAILAATVFDATIPGWASTVVPIYLICGVQMLCVGIIGEYVGKIYLETKRRPRSHVAEVLAPQHGQIAPQTKTPVTSR